MRAGKGGSDDTDEAITCQARLTGSPQGLSRTCGQGLWTNGWTTRGKPGDDQWTTRENFRSVHIRPAGLHNGRTGAVHKKKAVSWGNDVIPTIHSPYYYYVLITQRIPRTSRLAPDWGNQPGQE